MSKLKIKIEGDEYDEMLKTLVDMAIEAKEKDRYPLLWILQLFLYGEWEEEN